MTDFSNWIITDERGEGVSFLLNHRGVSVVLRRGTNNLAAQTVLIAPDTSAVPQEKDADQGQSAKLRYLVVGTASLDIQRGDTFSYLPTNANQRNFEVISVDRTLPGQTQARAVVVS